MNAKQKASVIQSALSGQHLHGWLPGNDNQTARRHLVSSMAGGSSWGQVTARGIQGAELIPWAEVLRTIARGCRVPGLRKAYEDAYDQWCAWARAGGYSPTDKGWSQEQRDAHNDWYGRAVDGIRSTMAAIIEAGATGDVEQESLF